MGKMEKKKRFGERGREEMNRTAMEMPRYAAYHYFSFTCSVCPGMEGGWHACREIMVIECHRS